MIALQNDLFGGIADVQDISTQIFRWLYSVNIKVC